MDIEKYKGTDPWQFEVAFAAMEQEDRMSLLHAMEGELDTSRSASLLLAYAMYGDGGSPFIRYQGLPWSSTISVPGYMSQRLKEVGYIRNN